MLDLSIVIVNWNTSDLLAGCLESITQAGIELGYEVIVVDNASSDGSVAMMRERFPDARLLVNTENVGFARANNQGATLSQGRYLLLLNSDAFLQPGALETLITIADTRPHVGMVGVQLVNDDGSFQASHTPFPSLWREFLILSGLGRLFFGRHFPSCGPDEAKGPQSVDYVEGACMLVRPEAYASIGGMDEGFFMYAEEVDLCCSMWEKGWQVWYQPRAKVIHLGSGSSQKRLPEREGDLYRSQVRYFRKHYGAKAAGTLKWMIVGFTAIKIVLHGSLRVITNGRYGRSVVSLSHLLKQLKTD